MQLRSIVMSLALAVASSTTSFQAQALNILVDQINPVFSYYIGAPGDQGYGGRFTTALAGQPGGYTIGSVANAADVANAYAIVLTARGAFGSTPDTLSATEIANLTTFVQSGGRIIMIGDNENVTNAWNNSIVNFAAAVTGGGAASAAGSANGTATTVVSNSLTQGVASVLMQGAGIASGGGGVSLFSTNFATLWGDSILTVLDLQPFRDLAAADSGDARFTNNVAAWLADSRLAAPEPTPVPAALPLFVSGLGALGFFARRRKKKALAA